jgi:hypothetical protein
MTHSELIRAAHELACADAHKLASQITGYKATLLEEEVVTILNAVQELLVMRANFPSVQWVGTLIHDAIGEMAGSIESREVA